MSPRYCLVIAAGLIALSTATAHAETEAELKAFCEGNAASPDQRIAGCTYVIDKGLETGKRLALPYCSRGHGYTEKRELDKAMADLNEALRLDEDLPCGYSNRGRVYGFKRDFQLALADYDRALKIKPDFALAWNNRGSVWMNTGNNEKALADFNQAIKFDPKLATAYQQSRADLLPHEPI